MAIVAIREKERVVLRILPLHKRQDCRNLYRAPPLSFTVHSVVTDQATITSSLSSHCQVDAKALRAKI
jgi:hypothetical protein